MGKIVVLASAEDSEAVKTALDGASLDFEVIEPTASNLLHIVIGMVDDSNDEEPKEEDEEKEPKEEEPEEPSEDLPPEENTEEAPVEESLGMVMVSGEQIEAFKSKDAKSSIFVKSLLKDTKTSFSINESVFSFWPETPQAPVSRMIVDRNDQKACEYLSIFESKKDKAYLKVGADLIHLFK